MKIERVVAGPLLTRAEFQPSSYNAEKRTVPMVASTGAASVKIKGHPQPFIEELSMKPEHIRLGRYNRGAPLLNSHKQDGLADVLGVVVRGSARIHEGQLVNDVQFSRRLDVAPIAQDVADGVIQNASVGYKVHKYQDITKPDDVLKRRLAVDWEPFEVSLLPIGADAGAQVRAVGEYEVCAEEFGDATLAHRASELRFEQIIESRSLETPEETMPEPIVPVAAPVSQTRAPVEIDTASIEANAKKAERDRVQAIRELCRVHKRSPAFEDLLIREDTSIEKAREKVLVDLVTVQNAQPQTQAQTPIEVRGATLEDAIQDVECALEQRMFPNMEFDDRKANPRPAAQRFRGRPFLAMAEELMRIGGRRPETMSIDRIVDETLSTRAMAGTTDFPTLTQNVLNKGLRKMYGQQEQTWRKLAYMTEVQDYKPVSRINMSGGLQLAAVNEHGEFPRTKFKDFGETYSVADYGREFALTRRLLINDDLGGMDRTAIQLGRRAADKESDLAWALLLGPTSDGLGITMADGFKVIDSTNHKNSTTGALISSGVVGSGLPNCLLKMRKQTDQDGNILNLMPSILVVPAALEVAAKQATMQVSPNAPGNTNPFINYFSAVIVEPRLDAASATAFYVFASPEQINIIEAAYLAGMQGPRIVTQDAFNPQGVKFLVSHTFGCGFLEYLSVVYSTGS